MVRGYPIVRYKDVSGAWDRLKNKLLLSNLVFHGTTAPPSAAATKDAIQDLSAICQAEGADISHISETALSFPSLIKVLEEQGLLKSSPPTPKLVPTQQEQVLSAAFRSALISEKFTLSNEILCHRLPSRYITSM